MDNLGAILYGQGQNSFRPGIQIGPDASGAPAMAPELAPQAAPQQAPQQSMPQAAPQAAAPQEDGGFMALIDKVRSDPALSQAALMAGVRLAQGARPGQTVLGLLGDTVQMGTTAYQMLKGNERAQGMQDEKFAQDRVREGAVTEGIQLGNQERKGSLQANIQSAVYRAEALARKGKLEEAGFLLEKIKTELAGQYASTPGGQEMLMESIKATIKEPALKQYLEGIRTESQVAMQGAQTESAQASTELTRKRTENPEKYGLTAKPQVGEKQTFAEWEIKQVMNAYGVNEAEAFRMLQQKAMTSKSPEERALRMKFITENYPDKPAKGIAAWDKMQEELAAADTKREKGVAPAKGAPAPQGQAQKPTAQSSGTITGERVDMALRDFPPEQIRADAAARNLTFSPEAEALLQQREARSKGK
jgi:hypothetical protein